MLRELRQHLVSSNQARHDVKELLDELKSPEAFARPLVRKAIRENFPGFLKDENALLVREWKNSHLLGLIKTHQKTTQQTLLEAALQNFETSEAEDGGMEQGTGLYNVTQTGTVLTSGSPTRFAGVCRQLDIGGLYSQHVNEVLQPPATPGARRTAAQVLEMFRGNERSCFGAALLFAHLRRELEPTAYLRLLGLQRDTIHPELACSHLTIGNVVIPNVLVSQLKHGDKPIILYTPQDPISPFRSHGSLEDLNYSLAERLSTPGYSAFFNRFVPLRHRDTLLTVRPSQTYWDDFILPGKTVRATLKERVTLTPIQGDVFLAMATQRITQIQNDARVVAVPTADIDIQSREKRLQYYADLGKSALFFAASFVPVVGEVLLAVSAAQLTETVYDGFAAWSRGDSDRALNDLLDIVDSAALAVATAGAIKGTGFTANLVKVQVRNKGWRLWHSDLAAYRHTTTLPEAIAADAQGIYHHEQRQYLKLDEGVHAIQRDSQDQHWQLLHPTDPDAYTPPALSNGVGGWRHLHETPRDWDDLKLIRRLGPDAAHIKPAAVEPILLLSGVDNTTLRQAHQDVLRPPPLLRDTVKRFNLEQEINDFSVDRAAGESITAHSPLLQFHSVSSLPGWPADHALLIIDEQRSVLTHGNGPTEIRVSQSRFRYGELPQVLKEQMSPQAFKALLLAPYREDLTEVENLALTLHNQVQKNRHGLFTWLTELGEKPEDPIQQVIHGVMPDLSRSHLEEMAAVLSPEQRLRLSREKSLTSGQYWEARRYIEDIRLNRVRESIYLDSADIDEGLLLVLDTLDRLPGWPASLWIEVRDQSINGPLLGSSGSESAIGRYLLTRQNGLYTPHDAAGKRLHAPAGLFGALEHVLSDAELSTVLSGSSVTSLKQAVRQTNLKMLAARPPAIRAKSSGLLVPDLTPQPLDPLFATSELPSGLTLRSDDLYQSQPFPDGFYRYYVQDNGRYFQVKLDRQGIQLIDARSPFRAYRPYIKKNSAGGWKLDETKGRILGGMPSPPPASIDVESSDEFASADSSPGYETAEDNLLPIPFTAEELQRMRAVRSYQHSQNYLRIYDRANNGRYPIRDTDGQPMRIKRIQSLGRSATVAGRTFSKEAVLPYIQWEGYEKVAHLYEDKLEVVPFTAAHQKFPEEAVLIGQSAVVNKRPLEKGEVIGVYGGELVPNYIAANRQDPYLIGIAPIDLPHSSSTATLIPVATHLEFSGDNILSRMNTTFEYAEGSPVRQAAAGYNVEAAFFNVHTQKGSKPWKSMKLTAFFANEYIPQNTELRWNYQYDETMIKALFGPKTTP